MDSKFPFRVTKKNCLFALLPLEDFVSAIQILESVQTASPSAKAARMRGKGISMIKSARVGITQEPKTQVSNIQWLEVLMDLNSSTPASAVRESFNIIRQSFPNMDHSLIQTLISFANKGLINETNWFKDSETTNTLLLACHKTNLGLLGTSEIALEKGLKVLSA